MSESNKPQQCIDLLALFDAASDRITGPNETFRARLTEFFNELSADGAKEALIDIRRHAGKPTIQGQIIKDITEIAKKGNIAFIMSEASEMTERERNFADFLYCQQKEANPTAQPLVIVQKSRNVDQPTGGYQMFHFDSMDEAIWPAAQTKAKSLGSIVQQVTLEDTISKAHKQPAGKKLEALQAKQQQKKKKPSGLLSALMKSKKRG